MAPPRAFSDDETVQALIDGTAAPAHLDYLSPIIAEDLRTNLFWFGHNFDLEGLDEGVASMLGSCPWPPLSGRSATCRRRSPTARSA